MNKNISTPTAIVIAAIALLIIGGIWLAAVRLIERPTKPTVRSVTPPGTPTPQVAEVRTPTPLPGDVSVPAATPLPAASPVLTPPPRSNTPTRRPGEGPPSTPAGPPVIAVLIPGLSRGSSTVPSATIQPDTPYLLLKARLTGERFNLYSAVLLNEERREVQSWRARAPQSEGQTAEAIFDVQSRGLAAGYYYLILYGVGPTGEKVKVDTYPFQIERP